MKSSKSSLTYWSVVALIPIASVSPGIENNYYAPFVEATNIALACLEEIKVDGMRAAARKVNMICQKNDLNMVQDHQGKESTRKPDVVILPWEKAYDDDTVSETDHKVIKSAKTPTTRPVWQDVLALIEFKRRTNRPSPPPSYEVKDYIPTKPEYRRVQPPEPDTPATAAAPDSSQIPSGQPAPVPQSK